jgi:hypothetical protein
MEFPKLYTIGDLIQTLRIELRTSYRYLTDGIIMAVSVAG